MTQALLIFLTGVAFASVGQVLMKKGALKAQRKGIVGTFFGAYTLSGYALMLGSTITSTAALKVLPLKLTVSLLPLGYLAVALMSIFLIGEKLSRRQWYGMVVLLAGVILFNKGPA
jgi:drug/metabolite transporter (DMT)-like permease